MSTNHDYEIDWKFLSFGALIVVLVCVALTTVLLRFIPGISVAPSVVTFDVLKYTNAQRVVASSLIAPSSREEATLILREVSMRTKEAIAEVAGPNALVVIKQAVVQGHTQDITDQVLVKLGLPTDVPSISISDDTLSGLDAPRPEPQRKSKDNPNASKARLP